MSQYLQPLTRLTLCPQNSREPADCLWHLSTCNLAKGQVTTPGYQILWPKAFHNLCPPSYLPAGLQTLLACGCQQLCSLAK